MKCENARQRLEIAKKWLEIINENYKINDEIIESQTEYFLVVCRSILDYVIVDYLNMIDSAMKNFEKADIIQFKIKHLKGKAINHKDQEKILDFLKEHKNKIDDFENDLLVRYFIALRNWAVHSIFPHIYENQYGENNIILTRRFQRNFVNYLLLENGGHLLLNNGYSLELESSRKDSIFDKYPLNQLEQDEKSKLTKRLETEEPFKLMKEYVVKIENLIIDFENKDRS